MTYPKATAPLTWAVLSSSNERAERWRRRYQAATERADRLQAELDEREIA